MIERILVDNFRCFVNFEWKPGQLALLMGDNGSGKTSVVDVLWALRSCICDETDIRKEFPEQSRTRWDRRVTQSFGLDVRRSQGLYAYRLIVEHSPDEPHRPGVKRETLHLDEKVLLELVDGELRLYHDDGKPGPVVPSRPGRSGLANIGPGKYNKKLIEFKRWLSDDVWSFRPDPRSMSERTDDETEALDDDLANFASWYAGWVATDLGGALAFTSAVKAVIPGFDSLQVSKSAPKLQARFETGGQKYVVDFEELSDGQRQLLALYVLRHAVLQPGRLVIFDEPDNYVALREVQPWLSDVVDMALSSSGPQIWFASHHPEFINQLAPSFGVRFVRDEGGPARVEPFSGDSSLAASEVVARGWEHGR